MGSSGRRRIEAGGNLKPIDLISIITYLQLQGHGTGEPSIMLAFTSIILEDYCCLLILAFT